MISTLRKPNAQLFVMAILVYANNPVILTSLRTLFVGVHNSREQDGQLRLDVVDEKQWTNLLLVDAAIFSPRYAVGERIVTGN